jgi:hypothetical protein
MHFSLRLRNAINEPSSCSDHMLPQSNAAKLGRRVTNRKDVRIIRYWVYSDYKVFCSNYWPSNHNVHCPKCLEIFQNVNANISISYFCFSLLLKFFFRAFRILHKFPVPQTTQFVTFKHLSTSSLANALV